MRTSILIVLICATAVAQTSVYLRDPDRANYCWIKGASGSPAVLTCDASTPHGFSVGDVIIVYNVQGNRIVNGIRKVVSIPSTTTFTIADIQGNPINSSGPWVDPSKVYNTSNNQPFNYGGASPAKLYTLKAHPRIWLDGPMGALTGAMSDASGRANPSGVQYSALVNSYNGVAPGYQSATGCTNDCSTYASAALKWLADGKPNNAEQSLATWLPLHPNLIWNGSLACNESGSYCGATQAKSSGNIDYVSIFLPAVMLDYELVHDSLTADQRSSFANFILNDNNESGDGLGIHGDSTTGCTPPRTTDPFPWVNDANNYCGTVWLLKHHAVSPFSEPTAYPTSGGSSYDISNNGGWSKTYGYLVAGLSLCGDDGGDPVADRGCRLASLSSAYLWDHVFAEAVSSWGRGHSTDYYNRERVVWIFNNYLTTLQNSVGSFPALGTALSTDMMHEFIYDALPYNSGTGIHWGEAAGYGVNMSAVGGMRSLATAMFNSAEPGYGMGFLTKYSGLWTPVGLGSGGNGNYLPWFYVFVDPNLAPSGTDTLPLQRIFHPRSGDLCTSLHLNCALYDGPSQHFVSRSGWKSTDTMLFVDSHEITYDGHGSYYCGGCIRLHKNQALLSGNNASAPAGFLEDDNTIEVGGTPNLFVGFGPCQLQKGAAPKITRWAGQDPTGDSHNRYAYGKVDLANSYCTTANVIRLNKHVVHLKGGGQDFVIVYVDGAASSPIEFREFLHYRLKQDEAAAVYSPGIVLNRAAQTISLSDVTTSAHIDTKVLAVGDAKSIYVGDQNNSDLDCSYKGSAGGSCRIEIGTSRDASTLAAVLTAEWVYIHRPSTNTSDTMPAITQPAVTAEGGTATAVQVGGTTPKVTIFARQGSSLTRASLTSSHDGTAQYLFVGMAPGVYNVSVDGTAVAGSPFTVTTSDTTLYFESTAGAVTARRRPPGLARPHGDAAPM